MLSPRNLVLAAILAVLAAVAVTGAWLGLWEVAVTGLAALGLATGVLALWAAHRAAVAGNRSVRRVERFEKAMQVALTRVDEQVAEVGARSDGALEALKAAAIRRPGEVVLDANEVMGMLRTIQAQHVGRLDRAQDALDEAVARLEQTR